MPGKESTVFYNVAFVGTGKIARTHALSTLNNPMTVLYAIADTNKDAGLSFLQFYNEKLDTLPPGQRNGRQPLTEARYYSNHKLLLEADADRQIDVIGVFTPPVVTAMIAGDALEAGKHIFCEKPIARTIGDAVQLYNIALHHPEQVFAVDFIYAAEPGFLDIKKWTDAGLLGDVRRYLFRKINEPNTGDAAEAGIVEPYLKNDAGPLYTGGSHYLYLLLLYTKGKTRITHVKGTGTKTQTRYPRTNHEVAILHFDDDSDAEVGIGWLPVLPKEADPAVYVVVIEGTKGTVLYNAKTGESSLYLRNPETNNVELAETSQGKANRYQIMWDNFICKIMRKDAALNKVRRGVDVPGIVEGFEDVILGATIDRAIKTGKFIRMPEITTLREWMSDMEEELFLPVGAG